MMKTFLIRSLAMALLFGEGVFAGNFSVSGGSLAPIQGMVRGESSSYQVNAALNPIQNFGSSQTYIVESPIIKLKEEEVAPVVEKNTKDRGGDGQKYNASSWIFDKHYGDGGYKSSAAKEETKEAYKGVLRRLKENKPETEPEKDSGLKFKKYLNFKLAETPERSPEGSVDPEAGETPVIETEPLILDQSTITSEKVYKNAAPQLVQEIDRVSEIESEGFLVETEGDSSGIETCVEGSYHYIGNNDLAIELWDVSLENELLVSKNNALSYLLWGLLWIYIGLLIGIYCFLKKQKEEKNKSWVKNIIKK